MWNSLKKTFNTQTSLFLLVIFAISFVIGFSNYIRVPIDNHRDFLAFAIHSVILIGTIFGMFYIISINRLVFILFFAPVMFLATISAWSLYFENIPISTAILDVSFNSEWKVMSEYVTSGMMFGMLFLLLVVVTLYFFRLKHKKSFVSGKLLHVLLASVLIIFGWYVDNARPNTLNRRVPFSLYTACTGYLEIERSRSMERELIGMDAFSGKDDSLKVVFILGESIRNDHLGMNGYARQTTPLLSKRNIVTLPNTKSLYTYTGMSVPQILTRADSLNPDLAYAESSFIEVFKKCNFETYWFANQNPEPSYYSLAKSAEYYIPASRGNDLYLDKQWTDENILSLIDTSILSNKRQKLIILHTIGAHWYYNYRYPEKFKEYTPITRSRSIGHNSGEEIINSYDNSVLYMDYFVDRVIEKMQSDNCIVIYLSDHGELLGEDGGWLHAVEHDVLHDAACFIWMSDKYKNKNPKKVNALNLNSKKEINTSFLFHSIIDAASIQTEVVDSMRSVFWNSKSVGE